MAKLHISHHERVDRSRRTCFASRLPRALQRHAEDNRDDVLPGEEYQDVTWDSPVRVMQTHFMA